MVSASRTGRRGIRPPSAAGRPAPGSPRLPGIRSPCGSPRRPAPARGRRVVGGPPRALHAARDGGVVGARPPPARGPPATIDQTPGHHGRAPPAAGQRSARADARCGVPTGVAGRVSRCAARSAGAGASRPPNERHQRHRRDRAAPPTTRRGHHGVANAAREPGERQQRHRGRARAARLRTRSAARG